MNTPDHEQAERIAEHRKRIAERGIRSVADLEEERHRLLEENRALAAQLAQAQEQLAEREREAT